MTVQTALKSVDSFRNGEVLKMTQKNHRKNQKYNRVINYKKYIICLFLSNSTSLENSVEMLQLSFKICFF